MVDFQKILRIRMIDALKGGRFRMSETANQSPSAFLEQRLELRRAYSNLILPKNLAYQRYHSKAKAAWSESEQFHGADKHMAKFIFEHHLLRPDLEQEGRQIVEKLDKMGYGFKRDITMVDKAVKRFAAPHAPNAIYRREYREMLEEVSATIKPSWVLFSLKFDSVERVREFLSNPRASTGIFSAYTTLQKKKDLVTKEMLDLLYDLEVQSVKNGTMGEPTLIGIRLQASIPLDDKGEVKMTVNDDGDTVLDFKFKTRLINMVSLPRIVTELHYSVGVQAVFGGFDWYAGGKTPQQLFQTICNNRMQFKCWDSLDYSAYDQSLPGWFIRDAFNVIKGWFKFRDEYDERRWDVMVNDFIHKGLISDKAGNITRVHDGVESGSMFTQIIDTLCNYMMLSYFCRIKSKKLGKDCVCNICGDDNIVFHDGWFSGVDYLNTIRKVFGVVGNASKSKLNQSRQTDPEYLSRTWTWRGIYRYWKELLIKLVFHERYRKYSDVVTPQMIIRAFTDCYPLGMAEGFDLERFNLTFPDCSIGGMSNEAAQAVGGIVAYEMVYGRHSGATM